MKFKEYYMHDKFRKIMKNFEKYDKFRKIIKKKFASWLQIQTAYSSFEILRFYRTLFIKFCCILLWNKINVEMNISSRENHFSIYYFLIKVYQESASTIFFISTISRRRYYKLSSKCSDTEKICSKPLWNWPFIIF